MLDVFICHAAGDREIAHRISARLKRGAEAEVWIEECGSETVTAAWDRGLSSAAILLVLSPSAVPNRLNRKDWHSLLRHVEANAAPPIGAVLVEDCPYPKLLERKNFFRWSDPAQEALRNLERWAVSLHLPQSGEQSSFMPANQSWFQGRAGELQMLWETLVDKSGTAVLSNASPGSGKTSLAQQFAYMAGGHFRDILWVECGNRLPVFIAGDLASQLGVAAEDRAEETFFRLRDLIQDHRLLLVFDDVIGEPPIVTPAEGRASVLITTRSVDLSLPAHVHVLSIESQKYAAQIPTDPVALQLWQAMSVCRRQGFPLELAARIADIDDAPARIACECLVALRCIDPLDAAGSRFRFSTAEPCGSEPLHRRHAEALQTGFSEQSTTELEAGLAWALVSDWSLATNLAQRAATFFKTRGRRAEAAQVYTQLREAARERHDLEVVENCTWELSWIQSENGEILRPHITSDQLPFDFL